MRIVAQVWGADKLRRDMRRAPRLIRAHIRKRLSMYGRKVITNIRKDKHLFDNESGVLKGSLWTERERNGRLTQLLGWQVPHGEVMEYGPRRVKRWVIQPKGFRSDVKLGRSGGGQALKLLRFEVAGEIRYARKVVHVWDDGQLRPHFTPHLRMLEDEMTRELASVPERVLSGELR